MTKVARTSRLIWQRSRATYQSRLRTAAKRAYTYLATSTANAQHLQRIDEIRWLLRTAAI